MRKIKYVNMLDELQSIMLEVPWNAGFGIIPPPEIKFFDTRSGKPITMYFLYNGTVDETDPA